MISPNPVSLLCALLLCLPLALIFSTTTTTTTTPAAIRATSAAVAIPNITTHKSNYSRPYPKRPLSALSIKTHQKVPQKRRNRTTTAAAAASTSRSPPSRSPPAPRKMALVPDDADDVALFQHAAQVKPNPLPATGPRKVAFMFLTTTPLPFAPLWELYFNAVPRNLYNVYVHADPRSNYTLPFLGVFAHRVIPSKPTRRHSPTLISAARRLLSRALLHDPSNYMFALISPSCIPLHSFNFTYRTLMSSRRSFIEILKNETGAYDRWAARGELAMLPEVRFEDFRIGSQFFTLTRRHARIVARDRRLWSKFRLPCLYRDTCYPEEHYFATLMSMVDPRGCVPATLTHVDWRGGYDGHPRTYAAHEVGPELIWNLRSDRPRYGDEEINGSDASVTRRRHPFLFARKFSPDSILPLMGIANDVILRD